MEPWGQFSWSLEGNSVPGNIAEVDKQLIINSVTHEHFGEYTCTAVNNILGYEYNTSFPIHLNQRGPPADPADLNCRGQYICECDPGMDVWTQRWR